MNNLVAFLLHDCFFRYIWRKTSKGSNYIWYLEMSNHRHFAPDISDLIGHRTMYKVNSVHIYDHPLIILKYVCEHYCSHYVDKNSYTVCITKTLINLNIFKY